MSSTLNTGGCLAAATINLSVALNLSADSARGQSSHDAQGDSTTDTKFVSATGVSSTSVDGESKYESAVQSGGDSGAGHSHSKESASKEGNSNSTWSSDMFVNSDDDKNKRSTSVGQVTNVGGHMNSEASDPATENTQDSSTSTWSSDMFLSKSITSAGKNAQGDESLKSSGGGGHINSNGLMSFSSDVPQTNQEVDINISPRLNQNKEEINAGGRFNAKGALSFSSDVPQTIQEGSNSSEWSSDMFVNSELNDPVGNYVIEKHIGSGNYSQVFQARSAVGCGGGKYALKKTRIDVEADMKQARTEADLLRPLKHEHIIQYIDVFTHDDHFYLVLEFADAGDLSAQIDKQIQQKTQWSKFQIADCIRHTVLGLEYLHSYRSDEIGGGIIHRDLKPQNILVCVTSGSSSFIFKIADFGVARVLDRSADQVQTFAGTGIYMSPEALSKKEYSFPTDIWALGCILFELCTLKKAFHKNAEIWKLSLEVPNLPVYIPRISRRTDPDWEHWKGLSAICAGILVQDPSRRPSCEKLLQQVSQVKAEARAHDVARNSLIGRQSSNRRSSFQMASDAYQALDDENEDSQKSFSNNQKVIAGILWFLLIIIIPLAVLQPWQTNDSDRDSETDPIVITCSTLGINSTLEAQPCSVVIGDILISPDFVGEIVLSDYIPDVTEVTGSMIVEGASDLLSITWQGARSIDTSIIVSNNVALERVDFPDLEVVGRRFEFVGNKVLESVNVPLLSQVGSNIIIEDDMLQNVNFPVLETVGGNLTVSNNTVLELAVFQVLTSVGADMIFQSNPALQNFSLPNLESVGAFTTITYNTALQEVSLPLLESAALVGITYNDALQGVNLPSLASTSGFVDFSVNKELQDVSLSRLESVGSYVRIEDNNALRSVSAPVLQRVDGYFFFVSNRELQALSLPQLESVSGSYLEIAYNQALRNVSLPLLSTVDGYVYFRSNPELQNVILRFLESVGRHLYFRDNALEHVSLPQLQCVGTHLYIRDNTVLQDFSSPQLQSVGSYVYFGFNDALRDINLARLNSTGEDLYIRENDALEHVSLPELKTLGSYLYIFDNIALQDVSLPQLESVSEYLVMEDNCALRDVSLASLSRVDGYVFFFSNPELRKVSLPFLQRVDGYLAFRSNRELQNIILSRLESTGEDFTIRESAVAQISLPQLKTLGTFLYIGASNALENIRLPRLESVISFVLIEDNQVLRNVSAPFLQRLEGIITFRRNSELQNIIFPRLESIGDYLLIFGNDALQSMSLPQLTYLGGRIEIRENICLQDVSFPQLPSVGQFIWFARNNALRVITFPILKSVGLHFLIAEDTFIPPPGSVKSVGGVQEVSAPLLESVGSYVAFGFNSVQNISLPRLESIGSVFDIQRLSRLQTLYLPALRSGVVSFEFRYNPVLETISLPLLESVDVSLKFEDNPNLSRVDISGLNYVGWVTILLCPSLTDLCIFSESTCTSLANLADDLYNAETDTVCETLSLPAEFTSYNNPNAVDGCSRYTDECACRDSGSSLQPFKEVSVLSKEATTLPTTKAARTNQTKKTSAEQGEHNSTKNTKQPRS